jgi:hypothetical protein
MHEIIGDNTKQMTQNKPLNEAEKKERDLTRRADHMSNVGTMTSLGSTGFWLIERELHRRNKTPMPKHLEGALLCAVTVGLGATIYSICLNHKAGRIALANDAELERQAAQSWSDKQNAETGKSPQR